MSNNEGTDKAKFDRLWEESISSFLNGSTESVPDADFDSLVRILKQNEELRSGVATILRVGSIKDLTRPNITKAMRERLAQAGIDLA